MIGILNYNMGNLLSVKNSLDFLKIPNKFVNSPQEGESCDKLILPGVGAFGEAMYQLKLLGFDRFIKAFAKRGKPLLGLCLGMQLLLESSEEQGYFEGLGLVKGKVLSFVGKIGSLPIPHVGWNDIDIIRESDLLVGLEKNISCCFVHSFYCDFKNKKNIVGVTNYGFGFSSIFVSENIMGCQFHPEKSQQDGLAILKNFNEL
jgi:imidazole glycerol-phosphate synthase subunit HisH